MEEELRIFVRDSMEHYAPIIQNNERLIGGDRLWDELERAALALDANQGNEDQFHEKLNELAVAEYLIADNMIMSPISYEPDILPSGRRIDFVTTIEEQQLFIEVKTVRPRPEDNEQNWQLYLKRRINHPENVNFVIQEEQMGAMIYGHAFGARAKFLDYTLMFEQRLAEALVQAEGRGVLFFCGTGFEWDVDDLEDFADFYRTGKHRQDDAFANMENYHIKKEEVKLLRNIAQFSFVKRPRIFIQPLNLVVDVKGPKFGA